MQMHVKAEDLKAYLEKEYQEYLDSLDLKPYQEAGKSELDPEGGATIKLGEWGLIIDCKIQVEAEGLTSDKPLFLDVRVGNIRVGLGDYNPLPSVSKDKASYELWSRKVNNGLTLEEVNSLPAFVLSPGIPLMVSAHNPTNKKITLSVTLTGRAPE